MSGCFGMCFGAGKSKGCDFVTIQPTFAIKNWAEAEKFFPEFIAKSKAGPGVIYYGFTADKENNRAFCREAYVDASAARAHLDAVGQILTDFTAEHASLESLAIHGSKAELAKLKPTTDAFGAAYYEFQCGYTNLEELSASSTEAPYVFCTIQPTFKINDAKAVEKFMPAIVERTKDETGLLYYGFTLDQANQKLFCREAYADGDGILAHLANVETILSDALTSKAIELEAIDIHGPAPELAKTKDKTKALGAKYYDVVTDVGAFVKFKAASSN
mmetsp:Transcript_1835/g.6181  ORF Transcript_1835/g.6181 Transcript_1835/m.6181 type:complete len:274 (+) Transcript_1835:81-902(+)